MTETYLTDAEYEGYFARLDGLRDRVARDLPLEGRTDVLDLCCGYGYFTVALARAFAGIRVTAIDLLERDVERARASARAAGLTDRVEALVMDATALGFSDARFDAVANFGGLEDVHMTRGRAGVEATFREVARVLRPGGVFCFTAMPPDEASTEAQRLELALYARTCGAVWLPAAEYRRMLGAAGLALRRRKTHTTGRRLTAAQARQEIEFACRQAPELYGIEAPEFDEVWNEFGPRIEEHGLGQFSRVVVHVADREG